MTLSVKGYDRKRLFIIFLSVLVALVIDLSISNVADIVSKQVASSWGVVMFVIISTLFIVGQFFISSSIKAKIKESKILSNRLRLVQKMVIVSQYILASITLIVVVQIVITSHYTTNLLTLATTISYGVAASLMGLLSYRLFSWFKSSKNYAVLLYCLAAAMITINAVDSIIFFDVILIGKPATVSPQSEVIFQTGFNPGTSMSIVSIIQNYSMMGYFLLMWGGTIIVLYHHIQRVGKVKFWIIVTLPVIYFMSYYISLYQELAPNSPVSSAISSNLTLPILLYTFSTIICGALFAFGFRSIAKSISPRSHVRDYMMVTAYGFILYFTTGFATVLQAGYPPFGLANVSFVALASYLIFTGLYNSAVSVAHDVRLRKTIKKSAIEESKLLVSIGTAQVRQEIERRVLQDTKEQQKLLTEKTGVQPSISEYEMKRYLGDVLKEIKVLQNVDEVIGRGREILDLSNEFLVCSNYNGLRLVYNNYFQIYEKVMARSKKGDHNGIRIVTCIMDKYGADLCRKFLDIGVQIRHVKNIPPIDFAVSDKEIVATIQKTEMGETVHNLLVSNEDAYIEHFTSIFDELWKNGIDAAERITGIEEGIDLTDIEIIQNPKEGIKRAWELVGSAKQEVLIMFSTANALRRHVGIDGSEVLRRVRMENNATIRILVPTDENIAKTMEEIKTACPWVDIRILEENLKTRITIILVDKKECLIVELKDDTRDNAYNAAGISTYSNSKSIVSSYASIFESFWMQTELYEQLKIHDKMQKEFINIAAHELRTPIQPLLFNSEFLKRKLPAEQSIDIMSRNAKKLQTLANNLLDVTRIEGHSLVLKKEKINLDELIQHALNDFRNQAVDDGRIKLLYEDKKGNGNIFIDADKDRINQVISNFLTNAFKFTSEGSISITQEISNDGYNVTVRVRDSGPGIDLEIFPRLFTKFATKSETGGTGLGLFISKSIVEAHGGKIWAENNNDRKGATFAFSLPIN
jgi:signal transduction histidine kinase